MDSYYFCNPVLEGVKASALAGTRKATLSGSRSTTVSMMKQIREAIVESRKTGIREEGPFESDGTLQKPTKGISVHVTLSRP
jgi:hypothetical protein